MAFGFASFADLSFASDGDTESFVLVTGNALTASVGNSTIEGYVDVTAGGNQVTSASGSVVITAGAVINVTGNVLTSGVGDTTEVGKAVVTLTGNGLTLSDGTVVAKAGATAQPSGSLMGTVGSGSVTIVAKAVVTPTGSGLTITTTEAGVITWNDVDTSGATNTWTDVAA
tara:strand:- start:37 stop:549 length:513 start_codon:yes stop_codon:yes gene_type:complete